MKSVLKGGLKKDSGVVNKVIEKRDSPFTQQELKNAWDQFAEKFKALQVTYRLLSQGFEFRDNQVILQLHNPFQETELNVIRVDLLTHLRSTLKNDSIQLVGELKIIPEEDRSHLYMNDKERLNVMMKKNPLIKELKDRFKLDTET